MLSNHDIIRLVGFVSKIKIGVVINLHLILLISVRMIDVTGKW
jgi:hypothetical protein